MIKVIAFTLLGVFLLSLTGELIFCLSNEVAEHNYGITASLYDITVNHIRWELIISNMCISGLTMLVCMRYFDKICKCDDHSD